MNQNHKFLVVESITGEGPVALIADKPPTRKHGFGRYRAVRLKPSKN